MGKLIEKTGNLFDTDAPAIGHGVNVCGLMGGGIALQFKNKFPEMYEEYRELCFKDELKPGMVHAYIDTDLTIYNIASQDNPGPYAQMRWLVQGVMRTTFVMGVLGQDRLALPYIGAGIGGLDPQEVRTVLREIAETSNGLDIELWAYQA